MVYENDFAARLGGVLNALVEQEAYRRHVAGIDAPSTLVEPLKAHLAGLTDEDFQALLTITRGRPH